MHILPSSLVYFQEVARCGSITDAAAALHVTPSAISRQITQLEKDSGVRLFLRHPRGMRLTEPGALLLAHTRRSEAETEELVQEMREVSSGRVRTIEVVCSEGLGLNRVPAAIVRFAKEHAEAAVHLTVLPSPEAARRVIEGTADVGAVFALGPQRDVTVEYSTPAPAFAVVSRDHPLATETKVSVAVLCEYPLSLPAKGISQRELFDIAAQMEGASPRIALTTDAINPAIEFARSGGGATLLSHFSRSPGYDDGLVFVPVAHPALRERQAQVVTMPGRRQSALVAAFVQILVDVLTQD